MNRLRMIQTWALIACVAIAAAAAPDPVRAQEVRRNLTPGSFVLELQGAPAGFLKSSSGGHAKAEVVAQPMPGTVFLEKHPAAVTYEPFQFEIGWGMEKAVYDWIGGTWAGKGSRISGAVLAADYNLQVQSKCEFRDALLVETALPALDAGSKEPGYLTLRVLSEQSRLAKGGGTIPSTMAAKTKPWLASSFRLEIPGLDCSRVRRIESLVVKQKVAQQSVGQERYAQQVPGTIEISDIVISLAESSADTWRDWAKTFLVDGNLNEKDGTLVLLGPDLQSELARIQLSGLGVVSIATKEGDSGPFRQTVATLYCEKAALDWKGGSATTMNVRVFDR